MAVEKGHEILQQGVQSSLAKEDMDMHTDKDGQNACFERLQPQMGIIERFPTQEEVAAKLAAQKESDDDSDSSSASSFGARPQASGKKKARKKKPKITPAALASPATPKALPALCNGSLSEDCTSAGQGGGQGHDVVKKEVQEAEIEAKKLLLDEGAFFY